MRLHVRSTPFDYLIALAVTLPALALSYFYLHQTPFLPCIVGVTLSSWLGGRGAGLFSTALSVLSTSLLLFSSAFPATPIPMEAPAAHLWLALTRELLFIGVAMTIVLITAALHNSALRIQSHSERLGGMLNSIANGVLAVDRRGRVTYLNPLAGTLTGWGQEALGRPLSEVFAIEDQCAGSIVDPLKNGENLKSEASKPPARTRILLSRNGARHLIEDSSSASSLAQDAYVDTVLVFREVTEQRRLEVELRKALERQNLALEAGKLAAWEWDLETDEVHSHDLQRLFPEVQGPSTSKPYFDFIQPDDALALKAVIEKSIETQQSYECQFRCIYPGGRLVWLESHGKPVYDAQNKACRIIGVSRNITEERLVNEIVRDGQAQFRNLAESAKDGFLSADSNGKILYANASCAALYGYSRSELIGRYFYELIPEYNRQRHLKGLEAYKATGIKNANWSCIEMTGLRKDGSEVPLELSVAETVTGPKRLFSAVIRDVSERKKNEQLMLDAKERLVLAQRIAGIGTYEWDIASGRTRFSPELEALYGMKPTTFGGLHEYRMALIHPDDLPRVEHELRTSLASLNDEFSSTFRVLLHDKSVRWITSNGKLFRNSSGVPETVLCAERDITTQKEFEAEREKLLLNERYAAERLALAQRVAGMGTYERDFREERVRMTPEMEALLGLAQGTFDGTLASWIAAIHPEDRAKRQEWMDKAIEERDYYMEYRVVWPDGSIHWLGNRGRVIFNAREQPQYSIGACIEVTQRRLLEADRENVLAREKAARAEAEHSSRLKDEFIATVSHELRTPLTAIIGWSEMLMGPNPDPELLVRGLESIDRNARAQARLVEDLLDLSRINAGRMRLQLQPLDLAGIVSGAIDGLRPAALAKKIEFELKLQPALVNGDADRLHQIVFNILFNAVKYSEREGRVEISVSCSGDTARLAVRDYGKGIAAEFMPRLFRLFSQEDASSTRRFGGMGLGLAIVKELVELHGGAVAAESAGENQGTTFIVELPLRKSGDTILLQRINQSQKNGKSSPAHPRLNGLRVLLVEDDADTRSVVASMLRQSGVRVTEAASAEEGLDLFLREQPQAALIDIALPGEDGIALLRKIRALPEALGGQIPAVAFTAHGKSVDSQRLLKLGFQKFLLKPAAPDEIREALASVLS